MTSYFEASGSTEARTEAVAMQQQGMQQRGMSEAGGRGRKVVPTPSPLLGKRKKCEAMGSQLSVKSG